MPRSLVKYQKVKVLVFPRSLVTCSPRESPVCSPHGASGLGGEARKMWAAMRDQTTPDSSTWLYLRCGKGAVGGKEAGKEGKRERGERKKHYPLYMSGNVNYR